MDCIERNTMIVFVLFVRVKSPKHFDLGFLSAMFKNCQRVENQAYIHVVCT